MHQLITHLPRLFFFILILECGTGTWAGGFQINMLGMKSTSMAGTATGWAGDASSVFHNPGAMTFQEYSQIAFGAAFSIPSASYLSPFTSNYDMEKQLYTPVHLYAVGKLGEKAAIGLSVNTPFHKRSKWSDDWAGRYIVKETNVSAIYVQPTFSYAFSEKFGVGAGPVIAFGKTFMSKDIPLESASGDIGQELDGKSTGFGFNLGLYYKHNENFSLGLNFRSSVKMNIKDGDASFSNVPVSLADLYPSSTEFSTSYTLPAVITAGTAFYITKELVICMDINYTLWKSFDSLEFEFKNYSNLNYGTGKFYDNSFAFRLGAQYEITEMIKLRAGVALDKSPVKDKYVSPENPDADRYMFSLGGSKKFGEHFSLDVAYMLQNVKEREVTNAETNFGGNYKSLINIFGITLNYQF